MAIRLGALGADDSLAVIERVAMEFGEIELIPVVYWEEEEIVDKVQPFLSEVDMWLCSGQVPYTILKQQIDLDAPVFYTRHSGEGLYQVLLYFVHEQGLKIADMSFDTLSRETMQQLLHDVGIDTTIRLKHYAGCIHSEELVRYHKELWETGLTKVAVTCLRSAELKLRKLGIPTAHITPTPSEVRQVLESVVQTHELLLSRDAQMVVQLIQATDELLGTKSEDELDRAIFCYARYLHGTKQQLSRNSFAVYTTRSVIEDLTDGFSSRPMFHSITGIEDEQIIGGIGIGRTVHEAEDRARFALSQAAQCGPGNWACAFENNTLISPMGDNENSLSYAYAREDLQHLSNEIALSALTLTKICSVLEKRNSTCITAYELADYLHVLPRSARRILLKLEESGLATVIGEETPYQRGRPRKIYDINISS